MKSSVHGKVAIVTGAALVEEGGLNIGGAVAQELVAEGAKVVLADINAEGARALEAPLQGGSTDSVAHAHQVDVRSEEQLENLVAKTVARFGGVDIVINNAGIFPGDDLDVVGTPASTWHDVMAVNARGAMLVTKYSVPNMIERGSGGIVNTASTNAFAGDGGVTSYGASKAALIALTLYTATQYGLSCAWTRDGAAEPSRSQNPPPAGKERTPWLV